MAITPEQARAELARRELARRASLKSQEEPSMGKKIYEVASIPMKKSQQGLEMMAQAITPNPETTGRPAMDVLRNTPAIATRAMSKVAPSFISPESMATAAIAPAVGLAGKGLGKVVKPVAKWAGSQAEEFLGMVPDSLKTAYQDAGLMFSKGKKAASPLYEEGKALAQKMRGPSKERFFDAKGMLQEGPSKVDKLKVLAQEADDNKRLFKVATKLDKEGALDADIAFSARKAMWKVKKSIPEDKFYEMLTKFNSVIKNNVYLKKGDDLFKKGLMSESLRSLVPRTASGKPSVGKSVVGALSGMGAAFSPAALGAGSTAAGLVGRKLLSPIINSPMKPMVTAAALLQAMRKNED